MSTQKSASVCYIMKNAAFAAGDRLISRGEVQETHLELLDKLMTGWFSDGGGDVLLWTDGLTKPMLAQRARDGYELADFTGDTAGYRGPCFAACGTGGSSVIGSDLFEACLGIAFLDEMRIWASVVYDPMHVELFHAVNGLGAYLNGKRISPAPSRKLCGADVFLGQAALRTGGKPIQSLICEAGHVRSGAPCALEMCRVACGRVDAAVLRNEAFIDCAAGLLIVQEAGAALQDRFGEPFGGLREYGQRIDITVVCPGLADELSEN